MMRGDEFDPTQLPQADPCQYDMLGSGGDDLEAEAADRHQVSGDDGHSLTAELFEAEQQPELLAFDQHLIELANKILTCEACLARSGDTRIITTWSAAMALAATIISNVVNFTSLTQRA